MKGQNVYNDPLFLFRATGRTHRMLERAMQTCREGKRVHIVFYDSSQFHRIHEMIDGMLTRDDRETFSRSYSWVRFGGGHIQLISTRRDRWDWRTERVEGESNNGTTFIDHSAYEFEFPRIIQGWAKYANRPPVDPRIESDRRDR